MTCQHNLEIVIIKLKIYIRKEGCNMWIKEHPVLFLILKDVTKILVF